MTIFDEQSEAAVEAAVEELKSRIGRREVDSGETALCIGMLLRERLMAMASMREQEKVHIIMDGYYRQAKEIIPNFLE